MVFGMKEAAKEHIQIRASGGLKEKANLLIA
jgi:hypothetical protein